MKLKNNNKKHINMTIRSASVAILLMCSSMVLNARIPEWDGESLVQQHDELEHDSLHSYIHVKHQDIPQDTDFLNGMREIRLPAYITDHYLFDNKDYLSEFANIAYKVAKNESGLSEIIQNLKTEGWLCASFTGKKGIDFYPIFERKTSTAGLVALRKSNNNSGEEFFEFVVAYHGTQSKEDALTDLNAQIGNGVQVLQLDESANVHTGFFSSAISSMFDVQVAMRSLAEEVGLLSLSELSDHLPQIGVRHLEEKDHSSSIPHAEEQHCLGDNLGYVLELNNQLLHEIGETGNKVKITFVGHSLGGATAELGPGNLIFNAQSNTGITSVLDYEELMSLPLGEGHPGEAWANVKHTPANLNNKIDVYVLTLGAPQTLNLPGIEQLEMLLGYGNRNLGKSRILRFYNGRDGVPRSAFMFEHPGFPVNLDGKELTFYDVLNGRIVTDHLTKVYLDNIKKVRFIYTAEENTIDPTQVGTSAPHSTYQVATTETNPATQTEAAIKTTVMATDRVESYAEEKVSHQPQLEEVTELKLNSHDQATISEFTPRRLAAATTTAAPIATAVAEVATVYSDVKSDDTEVMAEPNSEIQIASDSTHATTKPQTGIQHKFLKACKQAVKTFKGYLSKLGNLLALQA